MRCSTRTVRIWLCFTLTSTREKANMRKNGLTIDSNTFSDAYAYGIYNYYYSHIQSCSHNTISNAPHADSYYAYYGYSYSNIDKIIGNRVFLNNNNAGYGFYFQTNQNAEAYSTQVATFANNEIILIGSFPFSMTRACTGDVCVLSTISLLI